MTERERERERGDKKEEIKIQRLDRQNIVNRKIDGGDN